MDTASVRASVAAPHDLLLRVTAPRIPPHQLSRPRLAADQSPQRDHPVLLVQAPPGFGKTSLLAQWRRDHLARGRVVAWLSAQPIDDLARFVLGLGLSVRTASGRPAFGQALADAAEAAGGEGVTAWLAEVVSSALDLVLIVDEADRFPAPTADALGYLLRNAPTNLRVVVAARADAQLGIDDLVAQGLALTIGPAELRFQIAETIELVRNRFGTKVDRDAAARLHELTEGWPLGLQLALSAIAAGHDPQARLPSIAGRGGDSRNPFVDLLLANLDPEDQKFLTRIAILDPLNPDLCRAVAGGDEAAQRLARLVRDTPLFAASEVGDWVRMHGLARHELRLAFEQWPADEQAALHARAAAALGERGMIEAAAHHALAAGQRETAYDLAERSLYDSLMTRGRQGLVLEWLGRMPAGELDRRPRLMIAAAWSLALSERHAEAGRYVDRILALRSPDAGLRCEVALIQSAAAIWADDPDRFAELHDPWAIDPPLADPMLLQVHANRSAYRSLLEGEPAMARLRQQQSAPVAHQVSGSGRGHLSHWGDFIIGLSYLWEGQVQLAEQTLQPTLARAEADLGRRSPFTCMLAALLAAATFERARPDEAAALLADRLDVLEHRALPEAVMLGFRTMARIAAAEGAEHRALELLGALDAVGSVRGLPRLRVASLADQVRLHARRFRSESARDTCAKLDALIAGHAIRRGRLWHAGVYLLAEVARTHAAIAAKDWRLAAENAERADTIARSLRLGRVHIELLGLRAWAHDRAGQTAMPLLHEAMDLAAAYGLQRVFDDAHPELGQWVRDVLPSDRAMRPSRAPDPGSSPASALARSPPAATASRPTSPVASPPPSAPRSPYGTVLTPKEREVLELAARNLSNKEIGRVMQVGEETVKWHMKNLFAKLDAGTRKHAVQRARILGLLADEG